MRGLLASGDFAEDAALAPVTAGHLGAPVRSTIGRLTVPLFELPMYPGDFARDIRFVLDRVEDLAAGRNPDVDHQPLPAGLGAALDLDRVGMFGWSKGATATALVMGADPRVRAGLSFDGPMESDPPSSGRT
jgi:predicted dienelactone hydrolase